MVAVKSLFERDCEYRYVPGMISELKFEEKVRSVSPDFLDRLLTASGIAETDYFYLLGVYFYLMATPQMVTDFIRYYRNYYGKSECERLLMGKVSSKEDDPLVGEEELRADEAIVKNRLIKLARKHLLFAFNITNENSSEDAGGFKGTVFCMNYNGFRIIKPKFGVWPVFERFPIKYEQYYCVTPVQKMMETLHACRVGVMGFKNHKPGVRIVREEEMIFGARKEHFTPTMIVEVASPSCLYHVIVEPAHFCVDERYTPKSKHLQNIENLIETMNRLINHYEYMKRTYQKTDEIRFLLASENLKGMDTMVRLMNKYERNFSERVFFTTDAALESSGCLIEGVLMAKEVKAKDADTTHLGLVRPKKDPLMMQGNAWIFESREENL